MLLFAFYLLVFTAYAQPAAPAARPIYRNLVMEGGGIRGIAYGGALAELEKQGVLAWLRRVGEGVFDFEWK